MLHTKYLRFRACGFGKKDFISIYIHLFIFIYDPLVWVNFEPRDIIFTILVEVNYITLQNKNLNSKLCGFRENLISFSYITQC